jgi:hypothetical protein
MFIRVVTQFEGPNRLKVFVAPLIPTGCTLFVVVSEAV